MNPSAETSRSQAVSRVEKEDFFDALGLVFQAIGQFGPESREARRRLALVNRFGARVQGLPVVLPLTLDQLGFVTESELREGSGITDKSWQQGNIQIEFHPPTAMERIARVPAIIRAGVVATAHNARESARIPADVTFGDIFRTALRVALLGPQVERTNVWLTPTSQEATRAIYQEAAMRLLRGEQFDTSGMTPADRVRMEQWIETTENHGSYFKHGLFDWIGK